MTRSGDQPQRLGTSFHESFALNRPAIQQVLAVANEDPGMVSFEGLRKSTNLGKNYAKSMPRFCIGCGLLNPDNSLTSFGRVVVAQDPALQKPQTQWMMHYFMSVDLGPGPIFWHDIVTRRIRFGEVVDSDQVAQWVSHSVSASSAKPLAERTLRDAARVFLRSYSREDGLNQIDFIAEDPDQKGFYEVRMPVAPGAWVVGAALVDLWNRRWPKQVTANLSTVSDELGQLFFTGPSSLSDSLRELQRYEFVDIYRVAPPYQIARQWKDGAAIWNRLYD